MAVRHEAHVRVSVPPRFKEPPPPSGAVVFTVTEEFVKAEFGRLSVELAATNGMPVGPVIRNPLFPRPKVVVVAKIVVMFGVAPPLENNGFVAVTLVTVPCGCAWQPNNPPVQVRALVPVQTPNPAPWSVASVEEPVTDKDVEVAFVVEPAEAKKSTGKITWFGKLSVHVLFAVRSCAPALDDTWLAVPATVSVVALLAGVKPNKEEDAKLYKRPPLAPTNPLSAATFMVFENVFRTPPNVLLSPKRVEDAAVPAATLMVTGDAPRTANEEQDALPVHVTLVVAVEVSVLPFTTYASCPCVHGDVVPRPPKVSVRSADKSPPPCKGYVVLIARVGATGVKPKIDEEALVWNMPPEPTYKLPAARPLLVVVLNRLEITVPET